VIPGATRWRDRLIQSVEQSHLTGRTVLQIPDDREWREATLPKTQTGYGNGLWLTGDEQLVILPAT
jgi:hypothetical protein